MTDFANSTPSAVEIIRRENCFQGFYRLDRLQLRHELFAGGMAHGRLHAHVELAVLLAVHTKMIAGAGLNLQRKAIQ